MLSPRAPLFSVSLAFATGCVLGLVDGVELGPALFSLYCAGVAWLILGRYEKTSLAVFYIFAGCAGLVHTLLLGISISADDLRRLPADKIEETTQWRGLIIEEPAAQFTSHASRRMLDRTSFVLRMESWRPTGGRLFGADIDAPWQSAQGDVRCTVVGPAKELLCGDRLEFSTGLVPVAPPLCPGDLNYRAYEAEQGIYYHATIPALDWRRTETGGGDFWQNLSFRARDWAYERLQIGLEDDPRMADFLAGMLIGYRQEIPADIEQDFRRTGTLHVFAVSGQNIAEMVVVALILLQLVRPRPLALGMDDRAGRAALLPAHRLAGQRRPGHRHGAGHSAGVAIGPSAQRARLLVACLSGHADLESSYSARSGRAAFFRHRARIDSDRAAIDAVARATFCARSVFAGAIC